MAAPIAVRAVGLGKEYVLGETLRRHDTLYDTLAHGLGSLLRRGHGGEGANRSADRFWALRDVSFEIQRGEVLGVIGRNGAGKSTLLKILSRITEPTRGRIELRGRVASLLEVGTGFHAELTGRENIFLNGAILGMRRSEISRRFDEIVAFAGVEQFLDTPVKRYSSGMYVRLAFSVAAHIDPEILLIDEVLAVGDVDFQSRCLGRMEEVARSGRTVVFVSHNLQAVRNLCSRVVVLDGGEIVLDGSPVEAIDRYLISMQMGDRADAWESDQGVGNAAVRLFRMAVRSAGKGDGASPTHAEFCPTDCDIEIDLDVELRQVPERLCVGFDLVRADGTVVLRSYQTDIGTVDAPILRPGRMRLSCCIPAGLLNGGRFFVSPRIGIHDRAWIVHEDRVIAFRAVLSHGRSVLWSGLGEQSRPGDIAPILRWSSGSIPRDCDVPSGAD